MGRIAPVRIALEDVGQHDGDERGERHAVSGEGLGKAGARKARRQRDHAACGQGSHDDPEAAHAGGRERELQDVGRGHAKGADHRPGACRQGLAREDGGLRKARRSRRKDHECGAVGKRFCDGVRVGFEGVLLGRSEFGRDEDRGNVRLPMGKDVNEAVQVGLRDEEGRPAGSGLQKRGRTIRDETGEFRPRDAAGGVDNGRAVGRGECEGGDAHGGAGARGGRGHVSLRAGAGTSRSRDGAFQERHSCLRGPLRSCSRGAWRCPRAPAGPPDRRSRR